MSKRRAANVEEHPKGSGRFRVRARINGKLKTIVGGLPEAEAEAAADAYQEVRAVDAVRAGVTVSQFGVGFLDRRERMGIRGIKTDRNRWALYVDKDELGGFPLATLERRDILEWLDRRHKLAHQTRKNALNLLRVALQEAVDRGLLEQNPARDVRVHRASAAKETDDLEGILWPEEQARLLATVPERDREVVAFSLFAGVRQSSQWWLRAEDCHGVHVFFRRHKNGRPRTLYLLDPAIEALQKSLARGSEWAFPAPMGGRRPKGIPPRGWHAWIKAAGIGRRVRWHDLRHTCATSLLAGWWGRKWSLDEVCDYMGHSSVKVTERYARKLAETQRSAVAGTKFPSGNGRGGNSAITLGSKALCKTVIRGFESRPRLPEKQAGSQALPTGDRELPGNSGDAWPDELIAAFAEQLARAEASAVRLGDPANRTERDAALRREIDDATDLPPEAADGKERDHG